MTEFIIISALIGLFGVHFVALYWVAKKDTTGCIGPDPAWCKVVFILSGIMFSFGSFGVLCINRIAGVVLYVVYGFGAYLIGKLGDDD